MKCIAVLVMVILATVDCLPAKNVTTTRSPKRNETAIIKDRSNRDSRRYVDSYHEKGLGDYYGDYNSYKPRPNRLKGRRRQKPKTTTPLYDYDDFEGYTKTKDDFSSGFEHYFKHPYVGNVGKIFNQDDINDFYLKENNDYAKLVKDVTMDLPFKNNQKLHVGNTDAYKDMETYKTLKFDKKDSGKLPTPVSTTSWGNVKNLDIKNSYRDPWSSETKKPSFSSYFSQQFDTNKNKEYDFGKTHTHFDTKNKENDFGKTNVQFDTKNKEYDFGNTYSHFDTKNKEYDFGKTYSQFDTKNKEYDFGKTYSQFDTKNKEYDFGKTYSQFDTKNKEYDFGKTYQSYGSTQSPLKSYESQYPKSYASSYNFDTKPFPEIQPTKYTIPPYTFGKMTVKNTDYVSEFDMKGNPISQYPASNTDLFSEVNKDMYNMNKYNTPDFTKSFYDFNKQPETSTQSYFNFKQPDGYGSSNYNNNWGYASSYNYAGDYSPAYSGDYNTKDSEASQLYQKDQRFTAANAMPVGSHILNHAILVPVPQPYPVKVPVAKPVAVPIVKEIKVPIEKLVPYPVFKNVPYPVEKHIPVPVEKQVPVAVPQPYPVKIPIIKNIYHHSREEEYDHNHDHHHHNHHYDEEYEPKRPRHRGRGEEHKRPPQRRGRGRHNSGHRN